MNTLAPVSPHHAPLADQRSVEILEGVRRAFSEKGFDGASMQDLARACGMSVGNFYRYFPSKAAIVAAGPLANFILTICIFTYFIMTTGLPSVEPVVGLTG